MTVVLLSEFREKSYNPYGGVNSLDEDGNYACGDNIELGENCYPWGYLVVGVLWLSGMMIVVALIVVFPQWMTQKSDEAEDAGDNSKQHAPVKTVSVELNQTTGAPADEAADDGAGAAEPEEANPVERVASASEAEDGGAVTNQ